MTPPLWQKVKRTRASWWKWKRRVKKLTYISTIKKRRSLHLVPSLHGKYMGIQWKQWQSLFSWAPKSLKMVTATMKLKDCSYLEEKYDQSREHIKSREFTLLTIVCLVKVMLFLFLFLFFFPIVMYGYESWTIKKDESWRIDAFELWCWRRLLRVPWTVRRSNQLILKKSVLSIHWKDWCWSWNSNTLATWCEELTHWKRPRDWERLKAGEEGDDRGWDR